MTQVPDPAGDQRGGKAGSPPAPQGDLTALRLARGGGRLCAEFRTKGDIKPYAAFVLALRPTDADTPVVQVEATVLAGQKPSALLNPGKGTTFRTIDAQVGVDGSRLTLLVGRGQFSRRAWSGSSTRCASRRARPSPPRTTCASPIACRRALAPAPAAKLCNRPAQVPGHLADDRREWTSASTPSARHRGPGSAPSRPTACAPSTWRSGCGRIARRRSSRSPRARGLSATGSAGGRSCRWPSPSSASRSSTAGWRPRRAPS